MANNRNTISLAGIGRETVTLRHDNTIVYSDQAERGSVAIGRAVTLDGTDNTVGLADTGDTVYGQLIGVESDGYCVIQRGGFVQLPAGDGATFAVGQGIVGDQDGDSNPGFINGSSAAAYRPVVIDDSGAASGGVWVDLG